MRSPARGSSRPRGRVHRSSTTLRSPFLHLVFLLSRLGVLPAFSGSLMRVVFGLLSWVFSWGSFRFRDPCGAFLLVLGALAGLRRPGGLLSSVTTGGPCRARSAGLSAP